jgi:anthranilate synthase / indole-3-glycerol phosphate synthase / phosphoribosylanthranilate isomerase
VQAYRKDGVKAILVGEALMRAQNTVDFIINLVGDPNVPRKAAKRQQLSVKICGTRTPEGAKAAIEAGADQIGIILDPSRRRYVNDEQALQIAEVVKRTPRPSSNHPPADVQEQLGSSDFFSHSCQKLLQRPDRAKLVGVFVDAPLSHIITQVEKLGLDIVQLHGSEPLEYARQLPVPVIRAFKPEDPGLNCRGYQAMSLLDAGKGGSGQSVDLDDVKSLFRKDENLQVILAGGLTPDNVPNVLSTLGGDYVENNLAGVDVSSGVEVDGKQDVDRIRAFIKAVKG